MFPGITTKISESTVVAATTINVKSDLVHITGSTAIATIIPRTGGFGAVIFINPGTNFTMTTAGNIALAVTAVTNRLLTLAYSKQNNKWYPSYVS